MRKGILIFIALMLSVVLVGLGFSSVKSLIAQQKGNDLDSSMKKSVFQAVEQWQIKKE